MDRKISKYSFGIYLVHIMVIDFLKQAGLDILTFHAILSVPIISILVFIISLFISVAFNHIPFVKKYLV